MFGATKVDFSRRAIELKLIFSSIIYQSNTPGKYSAAFADNQMIPPAEAAFWRAKPNCRDMTENNLELTEIKQLNLDLALRLERYEQQLRRMHLINEIAEASNNTNAPQQAVKHALTEICLSAGWPLAHAYFATTTQAGIKLVSSRIWHVGDNGNFEEFINLSEKRSFKAGRGLPGIVLRDREALWANAIRSDAKRFALGRRIGLQSAFGFPVMMGDSVAAVLEFFSGQNLAPDEILLDIVSQLGMLLGRVFERAHAAEERDALNDQVIAASRRAGMAEVASGVLHDVGNVLNSITVSSNLLLERVQTTTTKRVGNFANLLRENQDNLAEFLTTEEKGKKAIKYMEQLARQLDEEQKLFENELRSLLKNVDHVKNIVRRQQSYASPSSVKEYVQINNLINDSLKINNLHTGTRGIRVNKELAGLPEVNIDKHNFIQILNNLLSNAKQALQGQDSNPSIKVISKLVPEDKEINISVTDNGCGISQGDSKNIFEFGFTTKKDGHGFGLHTSANTAQAMGGKLLFKSDGIGLGTTFTLTVPYEPCEQHKGETAV